MLEVNFHRTIQEHVDIDAFMSPGDEGRALGQGQDDPLERHRVVLGHHPPVLEAEGLDEARPVDRSSGWHGLGGSLRESAVVLGEDAIENGLGLRRGRGVRQPQLADQPVLEGPPQPRDPALGLRGAGRDQRDAQLVQGSAHLRQGPLSRKLLLQRRRPVRPEDRVPIGVDGLREPLLHTDTPEQLQVGPRGLVVHKDGPGDLTCGVIDRPDQG
ncbi:hypothetical protein [Candidatus Methylomirabilis sp.]|uniref:hypothetical protein n=1 Tax=Candidatus Methylomirabilis sp. TaxID=2032687 RepID=UPI002A6643D3|nr:hypothetical protein [Candidatus Methylomirabilis sp.]